MLKPLNTPSAEEFEKTLKEAGDWAESVGYKEDDVNDIIKSVREKNNQCE